MTHPIAMSLPFGIDPVYAVAAIGVFALVLAGWSIRRNRTRAGVLRAGTPTVWVAALAALACTAYSAETSWSFAADFLGMTDTVQRATFFSTAELALFANALLARQNLRNQGAPGVPGTLVWVLTAVQIIPAFAESGPVGGTVRAVVGPVMAAMLWHVAMGIELRLHKPDAASQGLLATLGREARERLLSRLGVATRNRDAAQITRERATERAGALASRLAKMPEKQRADRRGRRIERQLETALARSGVGTDPAQRRALLDQLAARRHASALATVTLPSPWTDPECEQVDHRGAPSPLAPSLVARSASGREVSPSLSTVPDAGPQGNVPVGDGAVEDRAKPGSGTESDGDRPVTVPNSNGDGGGDGEILAAETGTEPLGDRPRTIPNSNGDRAVERDAHLADRRDAATSGDDIAAAQRGSGSFPAAVPTGSSSLEHPAIESGTEPVGDHPVAVPNHKGDGKVLAAETGTDTYGDRPHPVPVRQKPKAKAHRSRPGTGKSRRSRRPQLSVEETVERVRPHVAELLERDGNASINRPQLREILRALNLGGGRNESLTPVLERLRAEAGTTMTGSAT
ncbi:hypothetical protein [Streptomyces lydicus]|uniref:hypothetical protein n=1 Tax=Streptomyces lydicus TaxID=47763 RepID=UPI001011577C|nr:hypothetical protein [Streptomyces lydicus]